MLRKRLNDCQRALCLTAVITLMAGWCPPALADDSTASSEWPKQIKVPEASIVVYQPQVEEFAYDIVTSRAAVSVTPAGKTDPIFGAVWFSAHVRVDRDARMVYLISLEVTDVKFPDAKPENIDKLSEVLKTELTRQSHPFSLDRLLTAIEAAKKMDAAEAKLNNTPPRILFKTKPAVLVTIDGKPDLAPVEKSQLKRVVNSPFLIVFDPASAVYYLRGGKDWWKASKIEGPWTPAKSVPAEIASLVVEEKAAATPQPAAPAASGNPEIIVATEPTELIVTDGPPQYAEIEGTSLLYVSNTENDIFLDSTSKAFHVLLAGRWYTAMALTGPWTYVPNDKLPGNFAKIPADCPKSDVLANVAGTPEATDALHEAYIPQTAEIDRKTATVKVEYDGTPQFKPIEGTEMQYAVNTPFDIVRVGGKCYCCHEGVWFVSDSATGPWVVCAAAVPQVIYTIPPDCPVYPVTYVYVYSATPTTVCVGYTAGYVGCYAYHGAVVYGTGYWYHGWHGGVYWPRPTTWGFGVRYNSVTGNWGFHAGYAGPNGWIAYGYRDGRFYQGAWVAGGWHTNYGGWWGHGGYHDYKYDRNVNINNVNINNGNINNRINVGDHNNIYNRNNNVNRLSNRTDWSGGRPAQPIAPGRPGTPGVTPRPATPGTANLRNDVYADPNGNIFRRTDSGWEQRAGNNWTKPNFDNLNRQSPAQQPVRPQSPFIQRSPGEANRATPGTPATPRPMNQPTARQPNYTPPSSLNRNTPQSDLNRQYDARQRGDYRTNNYEQYRSSGGNYRPSGNFSGGGIRGGGGGARGGRR